MRLFLQHSSTLIIVVLKSGQVVLPSQKNSNWVLYSGVLRYLPQRWSLLYPLLGRTAEILVNTIRDCTGPGTTIISDQWRAYNEVTQFTGDEFSPLYGQNGHNFVNPVSGPHTQSTDSLWTIKLCEFMWRYCYKGNNLFE